MITIIGSGKVGANIACQLVLEDLDDLLLIDIIKDLPQGEALDLKHMAANHGTDFRILGSNDYAEMQGSHLVIVPAGHPRKPGMTRMDLLHKNAQIIKEIGEKIKEYAPNSLLMMITNPLDVMTYLVQRVTGFPPKRVFGMGGMLDASRFKSLIAQALGISHESVQALVIGEHGEAMTPLLRFSSIAGMPALELLSEEEARKAVEETKRVAAQVIAMKGATVYAPAKSVVKMTKAILKDKKEVFPLSAYLQGEYGVNGIYIGVPAVLGREGVERILELKLNEEERSSFMKGVENIKAAIRELGL